jgi:hypothetical protein
MKVPTPVTKTKYWLQHRDPAFMIPLILTAYAGKYWALLPKFSVHPNSNIVQFIPGRIRLLCDCMHRALRDNHSRNSVGYSTIHKDKN